MRLLLDTNAYSALAQGDEAAVATVRNADELLLSVVVIGELQYGFQYGSRLQQNQAALADFMRRPRVVTIPVTETTADRYARIASSLRRKGSPIPQNDVWIAAQAMEHGAYLMSFDKHFVHVEGLILV